MIKVNKNNEAALENLWSEREVTDRSSLSAHLNSQFIFIFYLDA